MSFFRQEGTFDALRDAALAIKALGRWDLVVERSVLAFKKAMEQLPTLFNVGMIRPDDDFPFRWLFPKNGFGELTSAQWDIVEALRKHLFWDFRNTLRLCRGPDGKCAECEKTIEHDWEVPKKTDDDDYDKKLAAFFAAADPVIRKFRATYLEAKRHFGNNPKALDILKKVKRDPTILWTAKKVFERTAELDTLEKCLAAISKNDAILVSGLSKTATATATTINKKRAQSPEEEEVGQCLIDLSAPRPNKISRTDGTK
jgi:hypothetical protein